MQEGSASFQPAGLRISLERLSDRRLPQRYRGLLVILEDLFERGEAIPQFHALKLSLSLERFLERLQRQANPEAVPERLERMRSHPALVKNHEEVVGLTQEFLAAHTPPSGAPTSHLLVATALTNGTHHEDTTPHVDLFRATEAALTRGDDSALWVERVEVLRGAIGSRIRRLPPPCDELLQLVGDLHDQLVDERFPGPDIPDAARRFHLDLTLTAWRTRRLGSCPPGPTWEVAARLASSLERRGGIRPGSDLSHIRRALERLPTFRPDPDEETELRTWSALVTDLERVYWRAQGPRGDFLQAAYRLVRLLRPAGYEDDPDHRDDLEQVPPLQVISRIRSIDPEIPDAVAAYLRHRERAQEAGLLSDEDRHAVFEAVDNLLRFFDAGLARRVLLTGSHPLTYQRGFSSNSDAILDHLRNAALTWKPRDGFDHAAILRVHERAPPREVPILVGAVEEALATAPDAGPPAAWITLGSALVDLVTSKRLPTKISCEVLEAWLERRLQQARTLPPQQGRRASRAASQVATARWFLATEGRSCDPAASLRRAAAATREATRWSTALPSRDRLDWFRLLEEVEEWEPEADTPPELSEARNDLLAALHGLFRAVAGG